MSLFQWFSKKPPGPRPTDPESSGLGHVDATIPMSGPGRGRGGDLSSNNAANRKNERLERRELLYAVVRDSMTRAGVLSASYKFKVLSLDSRGRQYLIMMDLARKDVGDTGRLAEIEGLMAKSAKVRHDILVTAVYWRVNEHVTAGLTRNASQSLDPAPPGPTPPELVVPTSPVKPRFEPLQDDEVTAFKQALASMPAPTKKPEPGKVVQSGRRNPAPQPVFQDTQLQEPQSPLSGTQYGDLN